MAKMYIPTDFNGFKKQRADVDSKRNFKELGMPTENSINVLQLSCFKAFNDFLQVWTSKLGKPI